MATKSRDTRRDTRRDIRDLRWNLRVTEFEDALVRAASDLTEMSFTSFVRFGVLSEANRVLADRTRFELDEPEAQAFVEMLDRPARVPAGLRELSSKPSAFK